IGIDECGDNGADNGSNEVGHDVLPPVGGDTEEEVNDVGAKSAGRVDGGAGCGAHEHVCHGKRHANGQTSPANGGAGIYRGGHDGEHQDEGAKRFDKHTLDGIGATCKTGCTKMADVSVVMAKIDEI